MKMWRRRTRKSNNTGMSLVEVIVAIAILSIAILPVLHTFVSSAMYNARARSRQQTTAAAQTVLENFKAYSVKEICKQFVHIEGKTFSVNGTTTTAIVDPATNRIIPAPDPALDPDPIPGEIDFRIYGMAYQNERYDVQVSLRSHNSLAADMETLIYENRTSENAAAYVGDQSMDANALSQIAEEVAVVWSNEESAAAPSASPAPAVTHSGSEVDTSKIKITGREILFNIKKTPGNDYIIEVNCEYQYQVDDYQYGVSETGVPKTFSIPSTSYSFDMDSGSAESYLEIFNQSVDPTIDHLNLTVYYYPAYSRGTGSAVKIANDKITVQNNTDKEVYCYLYKQKNLSVSDSRVSFSELGYHLDLNLTANVSIYDDNLDIVLGSPTSVAPGGYDTVGNRNHGIGYVAQNGEYPNAANPASALPSDVSTGVTSEVLRQMYDVTVTVYREGAFPRDSDGSPIDGPVVTTERLNTLSSTIIE